MGQAAELSEADVVLYREVLRTGSALAPELAAVLARSVDEVDKSASRLAELGLVRVGDNDVLTAVSPMLAEATVLGAEDFELGTRRAAVEQRRDTIRRLVPDWNELLTVARPGELGVEVVAEHSAIANVFMHYADRCERELLSVAPGRLPATRIDGRTRVANAYSARRGIPTRALYQHAALRDRAARLHLTELAESGAKIRFASSVPGRSLVIDRSVALLPIPTADPADHGLAVVREASVIAWVVATFEQLWAEATPLEELLNRRPDEAAEDIDETRVAILRLMAEGEKDETISRRLSISVRTCRRHIADYMAQVGATSRFQAGVIAARAGHTDPPLPR